MIRKWWKNIVGKGEIVKVLFVSRQKFLLSSFPGLSKESLQSSGNFEDWCYGRPSASHTIIRFESGDEGVLPLGFLQANSASTG